MTSERKCVKEFFFLIGISSPNRGDIKGMTLTSVLELIKCSSRQTLFKTSFHT